MAKRILSDDEIKWAYKKWCEGYSQRAIAAALYVSNVTIHNMFIGKSRNMPALHYERKCDNDQH